jgi:hypothetical protein
MAEKTNKKNEMPVFMWLMVPFIFFMNVLVFGSCMFGSAGSFIKSLLFTGIYISISNLFFEIVVRAYKKRFPLVTDLFKRVIYILPVFYLLNCLFVPGLFYIYNHLEIVECPTQPGMVYWTIIYSCCFSTIFTFLNIGLANWEAWKASINETEKIKNVYQRSKVLGLKGQLNPHFLFNCFNTLSGLIQENEAKAEIFLDEMTKVHRYLLRSDDELLVPLEEEIKFAQSYMYLAKERFSDAISSAVNIDKSALQKKLPPLSMQVILEHIIYTNALSKNDPVTINIASHAGDGLTVTHTLHKKTVLQNLDVDDGLDNLVSKYKMLKGGEIKIDENGNSRTLLLPLFDKKENTI